MTPILTVKLQKNISFSLQYLRDVYPAIIYIVHVCFCITVTGDANFSMESTSLTVGGFSQPSIGRALIEQSGSAEVGLSQRFLWIFPQPTYSHFETLKPVNEKFTENIGKEKN